MFLAGAMYAVGGRDFIRDLVRNLARSGRDIRSTATAALQPPKPAEMERAVQTAAAESQRPTRVAPPVSARVVVISISLIIAAAVVAFYVTGRPDRERRA